MWWGLLFEETKSGTNDKWKKTPTNDTRLELPGYNLFRSDHPSNNKREFVSGFLKTTDRPTTYHRPLLADQPTTEHRRTEHRPNSSTTDQPPTDQSEICGPEKIYIYIEFIFDITYDFKHRVF